MIMLLCLVMGWDYILIWFLLLSMSLNLAKSKGAKGGCKTMKKGYIYILSYGWKLKLLNDEYSFVSLLDDNDTCYQL